MPLKKIDPVTAYPIGLTWYAVSETRLLEYNYAYVERHWVQTFTITAVTKVGSSVLEGEHARDYHKNGHPKDQPVYRETWEVTAKKAVFTPGVPYDREEIAWRFEITNGETYSDILQNALTKEEAENQARAGNQKSLDFAKSHRTHVDEAIEKLEKMSI